MAGTVPHRVLILDGRIGVCDDVSVIALNSSIRCFVHFIAMMFMHQKLNIDISCRMVIASYRRIMI